MLKSFVPIKVEREVYCLRCIPRRRVHGVRSGTSFGSDTRTRLFGGTRRPVQNTSRLRLMGLQNLAMQWRPLQKNILKFPRKRGAVTRPASAHAQGFACDAARVERRRAATCYYRSASKSAPTAASVSHANLVGHQALQARLRYGSEDQSFRNC
jgi:hypothetical protein